jgi:hypothetical protein
MEERKWPPNGYTYFTWMRIESLEDTISGSNINKYKPRLFSFLSKEGIGIQAFFVDDRLALETTLKKKSQLQVFKFRFEVKKW